VPASSTTALKIPIATATGTRTERPEQGGAEEEEEGVACPACTFLNHRSMTECEICSTPLPRQTGTGGVRSNDGSTEENGIGSGEVGMVEGTGGGAGTSASERLEVVRLSFRKGGEKDAYRKLKNVLGSKAWEREASSAHPLEPRACRNFSSMSGLLTI
jgi:ESCRT-II complex subunit VPS36